MYILHKTSPRQIIITVAILNLLMLVAGYVVYENLSKHYREGSIGTHISILLLSLIALTSFQIFLHRQKRVIWLLISLGFVFLAFDDGLLIHERLDKALHRLLDIRQTKLTDRLDDALIGLYGLIGAFFMYRYREEILQYKVLLRYLGMGFAILAVYVATDIATNDDEFLLWLGFPETSMDFLGRSLGGFEDFCKLMAEAVFLAGFVEVLKQANPARTQKPNVSLHTASTRTPR